MVSFESLGSFLFAFHSNYGHIFSRFDTIHERDGQTDRQTPSYRMTAKAALMHSTAAKPACIGAHKHLL